MNGLFYLACARHLVEDNFTRVLVTAGVNQSDMDKFRSTTLWTPELRSRNKRVLDSLVYATCDMAMLPKVDVPAEMAAAIIALTVSPTNWMVCASHFEGLRPARDIQDSEETVQIERVSAGKLLVMIFAADAAMRSVDEYSAFASKIAASFNTKQVVA